MKGASPVTGRQSLPERVSFENQAQGPPFLFQPEPGMWTGAQDSSGDIEFALALVLRIVGSTLISRLQASARSSAAPQSGRLPDPAIRIRLALSTAPVAAYCTSATDCEKRPVFNPVES
jgi:hypothetical protein